MARPQLGALPGNPTTIAFGDTVSAGTAGSNAALSDHRHAAPANPVTAHESASDPHTGYMLESLADAAGDIFRGTADNTIGRLAISVPAANILNVLGVVNGETNLSWKSVHDGTAAAAIGTTGSAGTSLFSSHRDHVHGHETAHVGHDTIWAAAGDVLRGTANDTGAVLSITVPAANVLNVLGVANGETNFTWKSIFDGTTPAAIGTAGSAGTSIIAAHRDHVHAHETAHIAHDTIWDAIGDVVVGTGADTAGRIAITVPAANIVNVLGVVNGETTWSVKSLHDTTAPAAIGTSAAGTSLFSSHRDHVHATGAGTPSTQAFGDSATTGSGPAAAMTDHKHAMPANPVTAHESASDPHTGYVLESTNLGPELVTNGTFTSDLTGWTVPDPTSSTWQAGLGPDGSGCLRTIGDGTGSEYVYRDASVAAGRTYRYSADLWGAGANVARVYIEWRDAGARLSDSALLANGITPSSWVSVGSDLIAPAGAVVARCVLLIDNNSTAEARFDNVSLREVQTIPGHVADADPHSIYIKADGTRAFTGTQQVRSLTFGTNNTYDIGTSSIRPANTYTRSLYADNTVEFDTVGVTMKALNSPPMLEIRKTNAFGANDAVGSIYFEGVSWPVAGIIGRTRVATPVNNDAPGQLVFATTPDGSSSLLYRWTIDETGHFIPYADSTYDIGSLSVRPATIYADRFNVTDNTVAIDFFPTDQTAHIGTPNNRAGNVYAMNDYLRSVNDVTGPALWMEHARAGTAAVQALGVLGTICWRGYDGADYANGAEIRVRASGSWSGSSHPTELVLSSVAGGSTTLTERWKLTGSGHFEPSTDSQVNLGSDTVRPANIYTDNIDTATINSPTTNVYMYSTFQ